MAPQLPKISIITPSYNQGEFIAETIESVLNQDYPDLEYIIMDGGSTDGTLDVLKKYGDRINWVSEPDRGQSHAINKGLRLATGEVIAFLNSDDCYEPGALIKVGRFFFNNPETYWLTGRCRIIDKQGKEIRRAITLYKNFWLSTRSYRALLVLDYISQPATFWRREVVDRIGLFNETLNFSMDYDYSLRVGQHYKMWLLPDYLACFRIHGDSKSKYIVDHFATDLKIAKSYINSPILGHLHALHNALIIAIYRQLAFRDSIPTG